MWLDTALPYVCGGDGTKHSTQLWVVKSEAANGFAPSQSRTSFQLVRGKLETCPTFARYRSETNSTSNAGMEGAIRIGTMRVIRLSGREASVVRAIGFADAALGSEIQDITRMQPEDVADVLNTLIAAGFVESIPYTEAISLTEFPVTSFEVNPAYSHELRDAIQRR